MSENKSTLRKIIDRNVERHLVKEFLMLNTKKAGFGGLDIRRTPAGTEVTIKAERCRMQISDAKASEKWFYALEMSDNLLGDYVL